MKIYKQTFIYFIASAILDRVKKGDLTREKISRTAAGLFAEHGLSGTSVRMIAVASGVNVAAISMYFESKEGLYRAVLEEGFRQLISLRQASLTRYKAAGSADLNKLLDAFVAPLFEMHRDQSQPSFSFLGMLSRTLFEPDPIAQQVIHDEVSVQMALFLDELKICLPHLNRRTLRMRMGYCVGAISQALADPNRRVTRGSKTDLMRYLAGGLSA